MSDLATTIVGAIAATLTSLSYMPQAIKAAPQNSTRDLSLGMLITLICGLGLWVIYGAFKSDVVVVGANSVGATLVGFVLCCKLRDLYFAS